MSHPAALVYIHPGEVSQSFMHCAFRTLVYEIGRTGEVIGLLGQRCASGQLVEARNETVAYFLDKTDYEWFWNVDADMGFDADTLAQLIASADPVDRPIVGALCFGLKKTGHDAALQAVEFEQFPTVYLWRELDDEVGFESIHDYPRDALVQVSASGAACFLVHRSALEAMRAKYGDEWFTKVTHPTGVHFSEDMSFFIRAQGCDLPVFVNTAIKTSHDKGGVYLTEETFDRQQALKGLSPAIADAWVAQPA